MPSLQLRIQVSVNGEPYRGIAVGIRHADGRNEFPTISEPPLTELLDALNNHLEESHPSVGTWKHKIENTVYPVAFTTAPTNY
jgi:hypothetical protein